MPSPFDITAPSNVVVLDNKREGVAVFTVKNLTRRRVHATGRVTIEAPNSETWASFLPPDGVSTDHPEVRDIAIDGNTTFEVKLTVPADVAPGSYTMKLIVADEINPDDNFTESPEAQFTIPEPVKQETKLPPWLIPAIIIGVLVIVAIVAGVVIASNPAATPTPTPTATFTSVPTSTPTATPIPNPFTGSWVPVTEGSGNVLSIGVVSTSATQMTITYTIPCQGRPPFVFCLVGSTESHSITGVPFNPSQLAASDSHIQLLMVPANNGQMVVTSQLNDTSTAQAFRRSRRLGEVRIDSPISVMENTNMTTIDLSRLTDLLGTQTAP
jgi:hypothetical protein